MWRRARARAGLRLGRNRCVGDNDTTLLVDPYQWPLTHSSKGVDHVAAALGSLAARWRWLRGVVSLDQALCPPSLSKNNGPWLSFTRMHSAPPPIHLAVRMARNVFLVCNR